MTRNRPAALRECLTSLALIADIAADVVVVDDTSDVSNERVLAELPTAVAGKIRLIRQTRHEGYIVARNTIVREAATEFVLLLNDDAWLLDERSVAEAVAVMERDARVGAVAFAMATANGSPWEPRTQPSPVSYACYVASFIGFAHLLRRRVFIDLGGYRESFHYYGEEKDYCRRLLAAGYDVVYVPTARVAHVPDPAGRNMARYLRYVARNDCLCALFNDPVPVVFATVPMRLAGYFTMRRHWRVHDRGGFRWVVGEVLRALPGVVGRRTPMTLADVRRWRELRRVWPPYRPEAAA